MILINIMLQQSLIVVNIVVDCCLVSTSISTLLNFLDKSNLVECHKFQYIYHIRSDAFFCDFTSPWC